MKEGRLCGIQGVSRRPMEGTAMTVEVVEGKARETF